MISAKQQSRQLSVQHSVTVSHLQLPDFWTLSNVSYFNKTGHVHVT